MSPIDTPQIVPTTARAAAVIRITIPREQIRDVMGPGFKELMEVLGAQGLAPAGPFFSHHLELHPATFDFELGVPVNGTVTPAGRVKPGELPAARVVRTIYHGSYEGLGGAWGELMKWITDAGHTMRADLWEVYLKGPESGPDPANWQTELNRPLAD